MPIIAECSLGDQERPGERRSVLRFLVVDPRNASRGACHIDPLTGRRHFIVERRISVAPDRWLGKDGLVRVTEELDRIIEEQDRSATFELIRGVADPGVGETERGEIVYALAQIADPRAVGPLGRIGRDRDRPVEVRRAALRALEDSEMFPEGAELRAWWDTGDDVVRASVLRQAGRGAGDLLESVARDPNHPLHRCALIGIGCFEEPHWQQYKIAGLDHPDPAVRRTAAYQLGWDEPVAAEPGLHRAATDSEVDVACAAIDSLRYYRSRATLRLLHELARGQDARATAARDAAAGLLSDFEDERAGIEHWLAPVADLLGMPEPDTEPSPRPPGPRWSEPPVPSAAEIFATYSDPDGPWAPKLAALSSYHPRRGHWSGVPAADRPRLAAFLSGHPDPQVRALCCRALSSWQAVDSLLALAHDPDLNVRRSAVYNLRFVPSSTEIATLTWDLIASGEVAGTRGQEALTTCAAHTPPGGLDDRLIELVRNDLRECVRAEAVSLLGVRVAPLLPLLSEPPLLTWAVHTRLLYACRESSLRPPAADALYSVDNLDVAAALADLPAR